MDVGIRREREKRGRNQEREGGGRGEERGEGGRQREREGVATFLFLSLK